MYAYALTVQKLSPCSNAEQDVAEKKPRCSMTCRVGWGGGRGGARLAPSRGSAGRTPKKKRHAKPLMVLP